MMKRLALALFVALSISPAFAQGGPGGPGPVPDPWVVNGNQLNPNGREVVTAASKTSSAGFNMPQGAAPTSPVNGDVWTTSVGLYVRINGATVGPLASTVAPTLTPPVSIIGSNTTPITASGFTVAIQNSATTAHDIWSGVLGAVAIYDNLSSTMVVPVGSTALNSDIYAYYGRNYSTGSNLVGLYGIVEGLVDGAHVWNHNPAVTDTYDNTALHSYAITAVVSEADMVFYNTGSGGNGYNVQYWANSTSQQVNAFQVSLAGNAGNLGKIANSFVSNAGASNVALIAGALSASGTSIASQPIKFGRFDGASAGHYESLATNALGFLTYTGGLAPAGTSGNSLLIAANGAPGPSVPSQTIVFTRYDSGSSVHFDSLYSDASGVLNYPNLILSNVGFAGKVIALQGATDGQISIQAQAHAGTFNYNLPTGAGTSGQPLLSGGGGAAAMTFGTLGPAAGGTGLATLTAHAVMLGEGTSNVAFATIGTAGRMLLDQGAGADPAFEAMSGDATLASSGAITFATVNSNVGTFGSATQSVQFTVNGKGLITAAANVTITPTVGSITGLGTSVATALGVNVGSAGAFVVNGGALGTPSSGIVTNLTGTASININGTVGANTPTTGAFTTVTASTSVTTPLHIGGSGTTGTQLTFQTTTGNGTTDQFAFVGGNNGGSTFGTWNGTNLIISFNGATLMTGFGAGGLNISNTSTTVATFVNTAAVASNAGAGMSGYTQGLPTGADQRLGFLVFGSLNATTGSTADNAVSFEGFSSGAWTQGSSYPSYGVIKITASGASARAETVRFNPASTATTSVTTGALVIAGTGGLGVGGTIAATLASAATTSAVCYNTSTGVFTYDGTIGTCNTSSMRFKHNIRRLEGDLLLAGVMQMRPVSFYYDADQHTPGQQLGLVAEDLATIDPRLVGYDGEGKPNSIRFLGPMVSYLVGAIQQQQAEIKELKRRLH